MDYDNGLSLTQQQETIVPILQEVMANSSDSDENLSAMRAIELSRTYAETPLPLGFFFDGEGWLNYQKDSVSQETEPTRICSRLEVIARTRDQFNENHGRLLKFSDPDGVIHQWAMPMELLAGDGAMYRQELLSKGLLIAPVKLARQLLTTYIQISTPAKTVRCIEHTGWSKDHSAFVLQNETIGNPVNEPLILQTKSCSLTTQTVSGTLEDWKPLAKLCIGNTRLIFSVSAAFAPPLLALLGLENGGIHFRGGSSSGKTTCLRVAASVWGGPDYVQQWRATANGLEGSAAAHNDCLLCLDEMGQMDPGELGKVAYMLANGIGKTRADKLGDSRKSKQWRLLFLSSGEISLADHMTEGKLRTRAGQEVRVLDIPSDGQTHGCFQYLHGFEQGKCFAEHLGDLCKSYYGTAGPTFVRCVLPVQKEVVQKARLMMSEMGQKYIASTASGQVHRAFNRFALVAVAGELATAFGITGWHEGAAVEAAILSFNDWLRARGDMGPQEERAVLSQVRHFFEQHGDSRFTPWHDDDQENQSKTILRVGFRKPCDDGEEFFVYPESFKKDITGGFDPEFAAQVCLKYGLLKPDSKGGATRSERLPRAKKSSRVYRFTSKVLAGEDGVKNE